MEGKIKKSYCENCGKVISDNSKFCESCGKKINSSSFEDFDELDKNFFYSKDWSRSGVYFISMPKHDILINRSYFYLIEFSKSFLTSFLPIIGFFIFSLFGLIIGFIISDSRDKKRRKELRACWIGPNNNLITNHYENNYYLKIPMLKFKNNFIVKKEKLIINYDGKKVVLRNNKKETERLLKYIKNLNL